MERKGGQKIQQTILSRSFCILLLLWTGGKFLRSKISHCYMSCLVKHHTVIMPYVFARFGSLELAPIRKSEKTQKGRSFGMIKEIKTVTSKEQKAMPKNLHHCSLVLAIIHHTYCTLFPCKGILFMKSHVLKDAVNIRRRDSNLVS